MRNLTALALLLLPATAGAAETRIVVAGTNPAVVHAQAVQAADRVCRAARAQDPLGDYGTQEECVRNTLDAVRIEHRPYTPQFSAR